MESGKLIFEKCFDKSRGPAVYNWHFLVSAEPQELDTLQKGLRFDQYREATDKGGWSWVKAEYQDNERLLIWHFRRAENDLERLQIALENHDWTYEYSDSHSVWQRGEAQRREIKALLAKTGEEGKALYEKFDK